MSCATDYRAPELLLDLMHCMSCDAIADAMFEYAAYVRNDPAGHFECDECACGYNCGEDNDCFACGEHENLFCLTWIDGEANE